MVCGNRSGTLDEVRKAIYWKVLRCTRCQCARRRYCDNKHCESTCLAIDELTFHYVAMFSLLMGDQQYREGSADCGGKGAKLSSKMRAGNGYINGE